MADKSADTAVEAKPASPVVPGAGADAWDSPSDHENAESAAISPSEPDASKTEEVTSAAPDAAGEELAAANARIEALTAQLTAAKATPATKREPLKLDLPEELNLDPTLSKQLQGLVAQLNERDTARETEHKAALEKLGALESDNQLNKQERALSKMLDALDNDHYRSVFEGEDANDYYQAAAKKVTFLRNAYKAAGEKVPTDRALFAEAARSLFGKEAEQIRAKGGRPRGKDRGINRVTPASNSAPQFGREAALRGWNEIVRKNGWSHIPVASQQDFEDDDRGI